MSHKMRSRKREAKKVLTFYFQTNKLRVDDKLTKEMNEMKMED